MGGKLIHSAWPNLMFAHGLKMAFISKVVLHVNVVQSSVACGISLDTSNADLPRCQLPIVAGGQDWAMLPAFKAG